MRLARLAVLAGGLKGRRLLEIGCGCGEFLVAARHRGASVFGNDISEEACTFVTERLHIPVFHGILVNSGSAFTDKFGQMDIVVMSDLIEHAVEPLTIFESALSVLRPGGLMLILTPNGGAAADETDTAMRWVGFRVDLEHLQYFSTGTISTLANKYHCKIEHLETLGYPVLDGIDRLPVLRAPARSSWKSNLRSQLKKVMIARELVFAARSVRSAFVARNQQDARCGSYRLFTILRKVAVPD